MPVSRPRPRDYRELGFAAAAALASMAALAGFALAGWPGAANGCVAAGTCFCEAFRPGLVRQPANTFSNLGFVAAGLAIAVDVGRRRIRGRAHPANPMTTTALFPGLYAVVVALLGPGSMALHASMTEWGGNVDVLSMYLWAGFALAYVAQRILRLSTAGFLAVFVPLVAVLGWSKLALPVSSDWVFAGLIAGYAAGEAAVVRVRRELHAERRWLAAAGGLFGVAFAIWLASRQPEGALCVPDSLLQGHAAWHLLCALATLALYAYWRSEGRRGDAGR